jgi:hypothetical protein
VLWHSGRAIEVRERKQESVWHGCVVGNIVSAESKEGGGVK